MKKSERKLLSPAIIYREPNQGTLNTHGEGEERMEKQLIDQWRGTEHEKEVELERTR